MQRCEWCTASVAGLRSEQPDAPGRPPRTRIRLTVVTVPPLTRAIHRIDNERAIKLLCDRNAAIRLRLPSCPSVTLVPNEPHLA